MPALTPAERAAQPTHRIVKTIEMLMFQVVKFQDKMLSSYEESVQYIAINGLISVRPFLSSAQFVQYLP